MKKILLLTAIMTAATAQPVFAESGYTQARKVGVFFSSAIAGAVLAGPIGMVAAAGAGIWLDEQVETAAEVDQSRDSLAKAEAELEQLSYQLAAAESASAHFAQVALDQLQLEMLFKTGGSQLTDSGKQRVAFLADFMLKNPALEIRLDGYSDPRGDEAYNLQLSQQRVDATAKELASAGVDFQRITAFSHGASQSMASTGDYDAYALERVVTIRLSNASTHTEVAQVSLVQ